MKKLVSLVLFVSLMISTAFATVPFSVLAVDSSSVITVTDIDSLLDAVYDVPDGGVIKIEGDLVVPESNKPFIIGSGWEKTYTITGGSLNFVGLTSSDGERGFVVIDENITFENTKLIFDSEHNDYFFASGYQLVIKESVVFEGAAVCFFGGAYLHGYYPSNDTDAIDVTLLAGKYTTINGTSHGSGYSVPENVFVHVGGSVTANTILGNSGGCTVPGDVTVVVDGNATITDVFGSGNGGTVNGNVYVTIGGNANVKMTYGGGSSGTVKGNTYVVAKDNANSSCDASSHDMTYAIFGGGNGGTIEGSTNVLFTDNAKANYIWGGCKSGGEVLGGTNITMAGGTTMSMYGGGYGVAQNCDATVTLTGGTLEQVFGGCQSQAFTGDVVIRLLGGTVKRRVFGGCYNDYSTFYWKSSHGVTGNIYVVVSENANLTLDYDSDNALSAHSRIKSKPTNETGHFIFTSTDAKTKYNGKINDGDVTGGIFGGSEISCDYKHIYSYTLDNNVITQTCSEHSDHSATATITATGTTYTGNAITVDVAYSKNWEFYSFDVEYANNVNAGNATALLEIADIKTINYEYVIEKIDREAPSVYFAEGEVVGVTEEMEYSLDGESFEAITPESIFLGDVFFRYAETENVKASPATKIYADIALSVGDGIGRAGDTVEVIVSAPHYNGGDLELTVQYDKDALTLVGASNGVILGGFEHDGDMIKWNDASVMEKNGELVKLYFTVNDGTVGEYDVIVMGEHVNATTGVVTAVEFYRGDIAIDDDGNTDGIVDGDDVVALREAFVNGSVDSLAKGADVNGDGCVDLRDLILLRQNIEGSKE